MGAEPAALNPRWSLLCFCRGPWGKPCADRPTTPRQVPWDLPAPLGASTHRLPPDADSALPGELPEAPSWGLCQKTSIAHDVAHASGSPGALVETGSFPPRGSSLLACYQSLFAAGWRVCTHFLCQSWKPEKNADRAGCLFSPYRQVCFSAEEKKVNSPQRAYAVKLGAAWLGVLMQKLQHIQEQIEHQSPELPWGSVMQSGEPEAQSKGRAHSHPVCSMEQVNGSRICF